MYLVIGSSDWGNFFAGWLSRLHRLPRNHRRDVLVSFLRHVRRYDVTRDHITLCGFR